MHRLQVIILLSHVQYFSSNANTHYLSNGANSTGPKMCNSDIIGVGNGGLEHPYKKVEVGKEEFKRIVQNCECIKTKYSYRRTY